MITNDTMIKMVFDRWDATIKNCDTLLNSLTDDQLQKSLSGNHIAIN